ncbi:MAG: undecaprenyl-phosphate glucose phosphotransferase, partial [Nitrosomonadales bacterium]|nr:undecaprenyl-phosphate glucose phosphotransferase [Nitrosomonadales bacterium]
SNSSFRKKSLAICKAWTLAFLVLILVGFLSKTSDIYSRILLAQLYFYGLVSQIGIHYIFRQTYKFILKNSDNFNKSMIVGKCDLAQQLEQKISNNPWLKEQVVQCVAIENFKLDDNELSIDIRSLVIYLREQIDQLQIRTIYIVTPLSSSKMLEDVFLNLVDKHVAIHWVPDIFSLRLINHSVREIAGIPVLTLSETPLTGLRWLVKSIEDAVLSTLILILISPLLLIVALLIKLDSPGPVFFRQQRAGWNGKNFKIWKFRSMYVHQEENGKLKQASKGDPRVTRIGSFIRRTSIDELPQLFNVILGDMSLVGPRPHAIQHDKEYSQQIFDYFARHNIKPGMTGLAQVRGLRGENSDIDLMTQRIESDIQYINNWSIWLDISILFATLAVFKDKNAY